MGKDYPASLQKLIYAGKARESRILDIFALLLLLFFCSWRRY